MRRQLRQCDPLGAADWEATHGRAHSSPEQRLLVAVLDDAVTRYRKALAAGQRNPELAELRDWFMSRKGEAPFGFEPLCELLGFNATAIRRRLIQLVPSRSGSRD